MRIIWWATLSQHDLIILDLFLWYMYIMYSISYSVYYSEIFSTVQLSMFQNVDGPAKNIV